MSKKKSLGSSPIGYSSFGSNSYQFIRDLGVSSESSTDTAEQEEEPETTAAPRPRSRNGNAYSNQGSNRKSDSGSREKQSEKKIVSYYLEKELIARLKSLADDQSSYYSSVVSAAIEFWVEKHGY